MKKAAKLNLMTIICVMLFISACSTAVNLKTQDSTDMMEKKGIWYNGQFWEGYENVGISESDIDSVVTAQMAIINNAKAVVNGKSYKLDFCMPEMDEDELIFINAFDNRKQNIILFLKEEQFTPGPAVMIEAKFIQGNLFNEDEEKKNIAEGKVSFRMNEDDTFFIEGDLKGNDDKNYTISITSAEEMIGAGSTEIEIKNNEAWISGELGTTSYYKFKQLIKNHPEVDTLVLDFVPGSVNDEVNIHTGALIRKAGYTTVVLADSEIYSGGVDLFLAGTKRVVHQGAKIGVHSWAEGVGGKTALDYPKDHPAHSFLIDYTIKMLGKENGTGFYFYTLQAAPAESIYIMKDEEIILWNVATEFIK